MCPIQKVRGDVRNGSEGVLHRALDRRSGSRRGGNVSFWRSADPSAAIGPNVRDGWLADVLFCVKGATLIERAQTETTVLP